MRRPSSVEFETCPFAWVVFFYIGTVEFLPHPQSVHVKLNDDKQMNKASSQIASLRHIQYYYSVYVNTPSNIPPPHTHTHTYISCAPLRSGNGSAPKVYAIVYCGATTETYSVCDFVELDFLGGKGWPES